MKIEIKNLKSGYSIYGNRSTVWNNTAHIYKSGTGNLCGTPSLASNWAKMEGLTHIGCEKCIDIYNKEA